MTRLIEMVGRLAGHRSYLLLVAASAIVIGPWMVPGQWSGNEINYFDLAYRQVRPEAFTDHHSIFDASNGRIVSFFLIGHAILLLGFDGAKIVFALGLWALYALSLGAVAWRLGLRAADVAVALLVFFLAGQELLGGSWIFGTVEAKLFAYIAVLAGIAAALAHRWVLAVVATALATVFHFLVGGFWGPALLALHLLVTHRPAATARLLGLFVLLILPIFLILLVERLGGGVDLTGIDRTINEIYAEFRNPHHVAPFADGLVAFANNWGAGLLVHGALALAFAVLWHGAAGRDRAILLWAALLNAYVPLAMILSFLDRETYALAAFYLFRPAGLIFLLSCFLLAGHVSAGLQPASRTRIYVPLVLVVLAPISLEYLDTAREEVSFLGAEGRAQAWMRPEERELITWLRTQTPDDAAILMEPPGGTPSLDEANHNFGPMERLTGRGFIVNFKFVPTDKADVITWYRRIQARTAVFDGDCSQLAVLQADYVVFRRPEIPPALRACTRQVHANDAFLVTRAVGTS